MEGGRQATCYRCTHPEGRWHISRDSLDLGEANWELAHRLLQCVAVASRPLRIEELADFLGFDFAAGPIPGVHDGWLLEDPIDAVLSTTSQLSMSMVRRPFNFLNFQSRSF